MHSCVSRVEAVSKVFSMQERVTRVFRVKTVNKELTVQKSLVGHGGGDDYPGEEGQRVLAQEEEHEGDPGVPGEEHNPDNVPGKSAQLVSPLCQRGPPGWWRLWDWEGHDSVEVPNK